MQLGVGLAMSSSDDLDCGAMEHGFIISPQGGGNERTLNLFHLWQALLALPGGGDGVEPWVPI
mgnify:CR=1 FL=1